MGEYELMKTILKFGGLWAFVAAIYILIGWWIPLNTFGTAKSVAIAHGIILFFAWAVYGLGQIDKK